MWIWDRKVVSAFFLFFLLVLFLLPFQVESIHSTLYYSPGGQAHRPIPEVNYHNAYSEVYVVWLHGFYYLTLLFLFFSKRRILLLFALIMSLLNLMAYYVIYHGLLFSFTLFGPKITLEIGIGYYLTLMLSVLLVTYCIYELLKFPKKHVLASHPELIDDLKPDSK